MRVKKAHRIGLMTSQSTQPKLHAALAQAGFTSRRKAEELIGEGRVEVNGQPATIGMRIDPSKDQVRVDGKNVQLQLPERFVFLVHKPVGIVSTTHDELHRETVIDFLRKHLKLQDPALAKKVDAHRLYPVGRLDLESEGLMIITNDGQLTQQFTHPSFESVKTYRVTVEGRPSERALSHLERGVRLKEGYTAPATVEWIEQKDTASVIEISIHEGKNQQVRRMCKRVGYPVIRLVRTKIGPYSLIDLEGAKYKPL